MGFAASLQDALALVEERLVDQWRVSVGGDHVAEADFAEVQPVCQHPPDGVAGPGFAARVRLPCSWSEL
jgi:hypothetical protein